MRNHRQKEAGFISLAFAELQAIIIVLGLLGAVIFGNGAVRITALAVFSGVCAWMFWIDRRTRFHVGDRVLIMFGPHRGTSGTVVEHLNGGRGARVAVLVGDRTETIDFHGGYEIERDNSPETQTRHESAESKIPNA